MISCRYPTGIFYDVRLEFPSSLKHLPTPGLEFHRCLTGRPVLIWLPNGEVQAVDDDVLHCLRAQQVQEVQLDAADADFRLFEQAEQAQSINRVQFSALRRQIMLWLCRQSGVLFIDLQYLGSCYWFQASLSTSCEVAGDLYCVWGAA